MKWRGGRRSRNVEDRRRQSAPGRRRGRIGLPVSRKGGGLGLIVFIVIALMLGADPMALLQGVAVESGSSGYTPSPQQRSPAQTAQQDELAEFVSVVLADTEDTWHALFKKMGRQYQEPRLVLFSGATRSACGLGQSAMGPFYCPGDNKVYIDLQFYDDLRSRFRAPGDFAQAYVVAHEVGHHVQNLLGISDQVHAARRRVSKAEYNALSVRLELQADCFSGVWAHHADRSRQVLEAGDIEEALNAASAIGDDRLQRQSGGRVSPESFTHGTSAQRQRWFKRGFEQGRFESCDTFSASRL